MSDPSGAGPPPNPISRPIWLLGWVSFFTDMSTEMVYPLLPIFLTRVLGAGAMSLGVIEGVAEAANSALKIVSGRLADKTGAPKKIVVAGYSLSSLARPLIGLATTWTAVLVIRFVDRLGKGIRGAPRDAMLAEFAPPGARGRVYGFHRAMDHAGAVVGPLIASAFLFFYPGDYRTLFGLTIVPGIVVILILLRVPDARPASTVVAPANLPEGDDTPSPLGATGEAPSNAATSPSIHPAALASLPRPFYNAMIVLLLFSLGNASDAFLLLRLSDLGVATFWIPLLWSALHVVKVLSSLAGGTWSDRFGRRRMIGLGWICYALVYLGFGLFTATPVVIALFLAYGVYFGLTEGAEKAWVADMVPSRARGTAFGIYNAVLGIGALSASLLFGLIWTQISPAAAFVTGASLAVLATVLLHLMFRAAEYARRAS